jgi:hypothetical protein
MPEFDWSKYQPAPTVAPAGGGAPGGAPMSFDWSKYQPHTEDTTSAPLAALEGLSQGATLGFGDELNGVVGGALDKALPESFGGAAAGKSFTDLYRENRDLARQVNARGAKEHPLAYLGGNIVGGVAAGALAPGAGGARAATTGARLVNAMRTGATLGAVNGLGSSDADLTQGDVGGAAKDTVTGAALGASFAGAGQLAGEAVPAIASRLADPVRQAAINSGRRVLTNTSSSLTNKVPLAEEAVEEAFRQGAIRPLGTTAEAAEVLSGAREQLGQNYQSILQRLEQAGVTGPHAQTLAQELAGEGREIAANTLGSPRPAVFNQVADELAPGVTQARQRIIDQLREQGIGPAHAEQIADQAMQTWRPAQMLKPVDAQGNLGLTQAESMKRELQHSARAEYDKLNALQTPRGEAQEAVASRVRQSIEDSVHNQAHLAPDEAAAFVPAKEQLSRVIQASNAASAGANRGLRNNAIGMRDMVAVAGGGAPAGIAMHVARTRGTATAASLAYAASGRLRQLAATNPAALGHYGAILSGALERGGEDAFNAHSFVLGQTDPGFQALQQRLAEGKDQ